VYDCRDEPHRANEKDHHPHRVD